MARTIVVSLCGAVFSFFLLVLLMAAFTRFTPAGRFILNANHDPASAYTGSGSTLKPRGKEEAALMKSVIRWWELGIVPLVNLLTGLVVGLASKTRAGRTAVCALIPLQLVFLFTLDYEVLTFNLVLKFGLAAAYFLLAYGTATLAFRYQAAHAS